jgi:hypothetical protein
MQIRKGRTYRFAYPEQFTSLPDYSAHRGQNVKVIRAATADEYDYEGDRMYHVCAADGWAGMVWASELERVK